MVTFLFPLSTPAVLCGPGAGPAALLPLSGRRPFAVSRRLSGFAVSETLLNIHGGYCRDFIIFVRTFPLAYEIERHLHVPRRREAGRPRCLLDDAQAGRLGLQPRLPLLLLPRQGGAVRRPAGRDERRTAGTLRQTIHLRQRSRYGPVLLARRRAVAAGTGFLPPGDGAAAQVRRRQTDREHVADQRYAGRRGVVRPLRRQQFPGRPLARRARGYP